jgi:lipoprotein-releasing system permease protein
MDESNTEQIDRLKEKMLPKDQGGGEFRIGGDCVVMNVDLARNLGIEVGDSLETETAFSEKNTANKVSAFSPDNIKNIRQAWKRRDDARKLGKAEEVKSLDQEMDTLLAPTEFTVTGLFASQQHKDTVILSLDDAQVLNGDSEDDRISSLAINTPDAFQAEEYLRALRDNGSLPQNWGGHTWIDSHRTFFNAIQNERSMMFIILMIIVIVATFSTTICMIVFSMQKRTEIGMLRALGAKFGQMAAVFASQGFVVGFLGVAGGLVAGLGILKYRNDLRAWLSEAFNLQIFPANVYGLPEIPAYLRYEDLCYICIPAFLMCGLAAVLPALFSFRDDPAKALRSR